MFSLKCSYLLSSCDPLLYCHVPHSATWFAFWCSQHVGVCGRLYFGCTTFLFRKGMSETCAIEPLLCAIQSVTLLGGALVTDFEGLTSHFVAMSCFFMYYSMFSSPLCSQYEPAFFSLSLFEFFLFSPPSSITNCNKTKIYTQCIASFGRGGKFVFSFIILLTYSKLVCFHGFFPLYISFKTSFCLVFWKTAVPYTLCWRYLLRLT